MKAAIHRSGGCCVGPLESVLNKGFGGAPDYCTAGVLIGRGARYDIYIACSVGDMASVRRFLAENPGTCRPVKSEKSTRTYCRLGSSNNIPLTNAARHGHLEVAQRLLEAGAEPNDSDDPPLTNAAAKGHLQIVELLLEAGADPDAKRHVLPDSTDEVYHEVGAPLFYADRNRHLEIARQLLEGGACVHAGQFGSGTAMGNAEENDDRQMMALLHAHGAEYNWKIKAELEGIPLEQAFQDRIGQDPDMVNDMRLLHSAAREGYLDRVEFILRFKPEYDEGDTFAVVSYLLFGPWRDSSAEEIQRVRTNAPTILQRLLQYGFNPNMRGRVNETPLHWLSTTWSRTNAWRTSFAEILLDHGGEINTLDDERLATPLGWAARAGDVELVRFFLGSGADPTLSGAPWSVPLALGRVISDMKRLWIYCRNGTKTASKSATASSRPAGEKIPTALDQTP
jgi:ankyrin repeat protein